MIRPIEKDQLFLQQKAQPATPADRQVMQDLKDTLALTPRAVSVWRPT